MTLKKAPLSSFVAWSGNPRSELDQDHVAVLQGSIGNAPKGEINLHQNLIAVPHEGKLVTIGGGHRLEALIRLANAKQIPWTTPIPYEEKEVDLEDHDAVRIALEENTLRLQMDAVDEAHAYFRMANSGKKIADIALTFGCSEKTARQRVAIGGLPAEALSLIRKGERTLSWGKALTAANKAIREKILSDIAASPSSWKDEQDIRKFLHEDTIPAEHALFDEELYLGPILRDMFEGNRFQDHTEFWEHQNKAIDAKKAELEADGWARVLISHNPVETWKYGSTNDKSQGIAIIEVAPNGKVTIYDGLVDQSFEPANGNGVIEAEDDLDDAEGKTVRLSAGMLEFGRTVKSAVIQAEVAGSPRKAKEIVVAGLLGHADSPFRILRAKLKGDQRLRQGPAFERLAENQREVARVMTEAGTAKGIEAFVSGLDDAALDQLMAKLVADRLVVTAKTGEDGMLAAIGIGAGNLRQHWRPTETFLSGLPAEELRNTAFKLLPVDRQRGILSARRGQLVQTLLSLFDEAAAGLPTLDKDAAARVNGWVPDWMDFAQPAAKAAESDDFLSAFAEDSVAA